MEIILVSISLAIVMMGVGYYLGYIQGKKAARTYTYNELVEQYNAIKDQLINYDFNEGNNENN